MQFDAMFLQLGIAGAALFIMYKVAMRWMTNEGKREEARAAAEAERTKTIQDGFRADIQGHYAITDSMQSLGNQFSRVEGKLDAILDLTPVREQFAFGAPTNVERPERRAPSEPKVIVDDGHQTPVERPTPSGTRTTPRAGVPIVTGGEYRSTKIKR